MRKDLLSILAAANAAKSSEECSVGARIWSAAIAQNCTTLPLPSLHPSKVQLAELFKDLSMSRKDAERCAVGILGFNDPGGKPDAALKNVAELFEIPWGSVEKAMASANQAKPDKPIWNLSPGRSENPLRLRTGSLVEA